MHECAPAELRLPLANTATVKKHLDLTLSQPLSSSIIIAVINIIIAVIDGGAISTRCSLALCAAFFIPNANIKHGG